VARAAGGKSTGERYIAALARLHPLRSGRRGWTWRRHHDESDAKTQACSTEQTERKGKKQLLLFVANRYMFVVTSRGQQRAKHSAIIRARAYSSFRVDGGPNVMSRGPVSQSRKQKKKKRRCVRAQLHGCNAQCRGERVIVEHCGCWCYANGLLPCQRSCRSRSEQPLLASALARGLGSPPVTTQEVEQQPAVASGAVATASGPSLSAVRCR
jgi:hypothetical protein